MKVCTHVCVCVACPCREGGVCIYSVAEAFAWMTQKRPEDESYGQERAPGPDSACLRRAAEADRPQPPALASAPYLFAFTTTARGTDRGTEDPVQAVAHASPALPAEGGRPVTAELHRAWGFPEEP